MSLVSGLAQHLIVMFFKRVQRKSAIRCSRAHRILSLLTKATKLDEGEYPEGTSIGAESRNKNTRAEHKKLIEWLSTSSTLFNDGDLEQDEYGPNVIAYEQCNECSSSE